jgi:hypothetical protein
MDQAPAAKALDSVLQWTWAQDLLPRTAAAERTQAQSFPLSQAPRLACPPAVALDRSPCLLRAETNLDWAALAAVRALAATMAPAAL